MKNVFDQSHHYPPLFEIPDVPDETENLFLFRNKIKKIIFHKTYENIARLDLSDNLIKEVSSFAQIVNLKVLDLSYNLLSEVTSEFIESLENIEELYLHCNDITDITDLDASDCCRESLVKNNLTILNFSMKHLKKLDLANNYLHQIPIVSETVEELYLAGNHIRDIKYHSRNEWSVKKLSNLKILGLENTSVSEIDCENLPKSLMKLMLSDSKELKELKNIEYLENLIFLDLSGTKIQQKNIQLKNKIKVYF